MEPQHRSIRSLVDMYMNQELLLPEIQRKYVWRPSQVRDLLDSIYRNYPSGSILLWETDVFPATKDHPFEASKQGAIGKKLQLLDGQQRITSLAAVIKGAKIRIREGNSIREKSLEVFFNIDHPQDDVSDFSGKYEIGDIVEGKWEEDGEFYPGRIDDIDGTRFHIQYEDGDEGWTNEVREPGETTRRNLILQIKNRMIEGRKEWIKVTKLFQHGVGTILRDLKISPSDSKYDLWNDRLNSLYQKLDSYFYPVQVIRDKSYREVTEIFVRVNSSGTRLRGSDLALARITSVWHGSLSLLEGFVDQCRKEHFDLDTNFLARCLVLVSTDQPEFDRIQGITASVWEDAWKKVQPAVQQAIDFVRNNAFVDCLAVLPSPSLLLPLIYFAAKGKWADGSKKEGPVLRWLFNAGMWGRYSGTFETRLAQDIACIKSPNPWETMLENVWQQVGKNRRVQASDIRGKGTNSPFFFMMYILARKNRARDYSTGQMINRSNFCPDNKLQFDHVFPRSKLDKILADRLTKVERRRVVNELANIAFLTRKGNIIKSNDDPMDYFPRIIEKYGPQEFQLQSIPHDKALLGFDAYERFLEVRAGFLAEAINEFMTNI